MRSPGLTLGAHPANDEVVLKHSVCYRRACDDIAVILYRDGGYNIAVAAYEAVVANRSSVLRFSVVVFENCSSADIAAASEVGISHVG